MTSADPSVLFVAGGYPWPLDSGPHLRQYQILRALSRVAAVDLLVVQRGRRPAPPEIAGLCRNVYVQPWPRRTGRIRRWMRWARGWPLDDGPIPRSRLRPDVAAALDNHHRPIWVERLQVALPLRLTDRPMVVLDLDDIEHRKLEQRARLPGPGWRRRWSSTLRASVWRRCELNLSNRFARIVVCSEQDRRYLDHDNVRVVPNGIRVDAGEPFTPGVAGRMVFVGQMDYAPNEDAMRFFLGEVLPRIRKEEPRAHVQVVGGRPGAAMRACHDGETVTVCGYVPEVAPLLRDAAVAIAPLRIGSGTRLKILEAMALNKPVVSTSLGAEGLGLQSGVHAILADDPADFASACVRLLRDCDRRRRIAEAGHRLVLEKYDWDVVAGSVEAIVREWIPAFETGDPSSETESVVLGDGLDPGIGEAAARPAGQRPSRAPGRG